jgi:hypothetical protein
MRRVVAGTRHLSSTPATAGGSRVVITVALLLLPVLGLMLYGLDRVEDWMAREPQEPRHASGRHLRLIPGTDRLPVGRRPDARRGRHRHAA